MAKSKTSSRGFIDCADAINHKLSHSQALIGLLIQDFDGTNEDGNFALRPGSILSAVSDLGHKLDRMSVSVEGMLDAWKAAAQNGQGGNRNE